jgi:hypothetical protein
VASRGPRRSAFGGRVVFDKRGRAQDPDSRAWLSSRQIAARKGAFHREVSAREERRAPAPKSIPKGGERRPEPRFEPAEPGRAQPRIPQGAPGAGRFLPAGYLGEIREQRLRLLVEGNETEFVRVHVGKAEFRVRNVESNIRRWVAGAAIARAIQEGATVAAGMSVEEISDLVLGLEEAGFDGLEDFDPGDEGVSIEPD